MGTYRQAVVALATWALGAMAWATQPPALAVSEDLRRLDLAPYLEAYEDPGGELQADVVTATAFTGFADFEKDAVNLGYTRSAWWFRFRLTNAQLVPVTIFLEAGYPLIDSIRLYEPSEVGYREMALGDRLPFAERPVLSHVFAVPLAVPAGATLTYYLRVQTTSSLDIPLTVSSSVHYVEWVHDNQWVMGLIYGVLAGLLFYNLFLFVTVRERSFLYYVLYIVFTVGYLSALDGGQYRVFPDLVLWQQYSVYVCINMAMFVLFLFTRENLALEEAPPWLRRCVTVVLYINAGAILAHFLLDLAVTARMSIVIGLLSFVVALVIGVVRLVQGYAAARFYVFAFTVFVVIGITTMLAAWGIIPGYEVARYGLKFSIVLKLIVLSLSLGDRINVLQQREFELEREAIHAQAQSQATSDFLAKMSHEIRTPMNGVLGMAQLLGDTNLSRLQRQFVNTISSSGRALVTVINDILDFSKIEAGKMELEDIGFNLEEVLNDSISIFALRADEKGVEFVLSVRPGTPEFVRGDPTRLRQVVLNLLGNAFKFTDQGHVLVSVAAARGEDDKDVLRFEISDTGPGISPEASRRLFQSFMQADSSTTRQYGGTGLGLAISRQLVELMGGRIGVRSEEGQGSTFWFEIPCRSPDNVDELQAYCAADLESCRILIVDDHEIFCQTIQQELLARGVTVDVALSGKAAARLVERLRGERDFYRAIFIEKRLPDMSGDSLARNLVARTARKDTTLVLMAGMRDCEDDQESRAAGFDQVISKPLSSAQFRDALQQVLGIGKAQRTGEPAVEAVSADYSHLRVLVADDNAVNLMVIRGLLKKLRIEPDTVDNGREARDAYARAEQPYDLVFMDCEMPVMDGYTAAAEIRDIEKERRMRAAVIIALSAHVLPELQRKSLESGMDDHIAKPVQMPILCQRMAHWFPADESTAQAG